MYGSYVCLYTIFWILDHPGRINVCHYYKYLTWFHMLCICHIYKTCMSCILNIFLIKLWMRVGRQKPETLTWSKERWSTLKCVVHCVNAKLNHATCVNEPYRHVFMHFIHSFLFSHFSFFTIFIALFILLYATFMKNKI